MPIEWKNLVAFSNLISPYRPSRKSYQTIEFKAANFLVEWYSVGNGYILSFSISISDRFLSITVLFKHFDLLPNNWVQSSQFLSWMIFCGQRLYFHFPYPSVISVNHCIIQTFRFTWGSYALQFAAGCYLYSYKLVVLSDDTKIA